MRIISLEGHCPFRPMKEDSKFIWYRIDNKRDVEYLLSEFPDLKNTPWDFEHSIGSKICIEPMEKIGDIQTYCVHWLGEILDQIEWFCGQLGYKCTFMQTEDDKKLISYEEEPLDADE